MTPKEPLHESHMVAHCVLRIECKASEAVNGCSLHNELNAAVRLQNQCPEGLWQNHALAVSRASAS
ncbi:hypothetical protein [Nitrosomonas sp.]|uniref:hypothetical protein n=1 Tax=Nitrosomonas sp. TaxID=42353 RepID=UPI00330621D5